MAGQIYDTNEEKTMRELVNKQNKLLREVETSDSVMNQKIFQYSILGVGAILALFVFRYFVKKK